MTQYYLMKMEHVMRIFSIGIGLLIVNYIIYVRLIYVRLPKDLYANINSTLLIIYVVILSIFLILFIRVIVTKYKKQKSLEVSNKYHIKNIMKNLVSIYTISLLSLDDLIKNKIFMGSGNFMLVCGEFLYKNFNRKFRMISLLILFSVIPKLICVSAFLVDVIIYQKFDYFYKCSFILLVPVILTYILFSLRDLCEKNLIKLNDDIDIFHNNNLRLSPFDFTFKRLSLNNNLNLNNYSFQLSPSYQLLYIDDTTENLLDNLVRLTRLYQKFHNIFAFILDMNLLLEKILPFVNIFIYLFYIIGWSYIIWFGWSNDFNYILEYVPIFLDTIEPFSGIIL